MVHRDLKPANVMIGAFGEVQVVDWGFAKVLRRGGAADDRARPAAVPQPSVIETVRTQGDGSESLAGSVIGTPGYMPPEQALGDVEHMDERSDVFSLGAVLCEILTGQPPYTKEQQDEKTDMIGVAARALLEPAFARLEASTADRELVAITRHCLAASRHARPRDASVLAQEIHDYLASVEERARSSELEAAEAKVKAQEERRARRLTLALAAAVLISVVLAGGGWTWVEAAERSRLRRVEQEARTAIQEAVQLESRAADREPRSAAPLYTQALAAANRAQRTLEAGAGDSELAAQTRALGARLGSAHAEARQRAEKLDLHDALLGKLNEARIPTEDDLSGSKWRRRWAQDLDRTYAAIFAEHDIEVDGPPAEVADKLGGEHGLAFAAAFDHWAHQRRTLAIEDEQTPPHLARVAPLVAIARHLDPGDGYRNEMRAQLGREQLDTAHLVDRAATIDPAGREPLTLLLLGMLLEDEHRDHAVELYRRSRRCHPEDLSLNFRLGLALETSKPPRHQDALPFYVAAQTMAPGSGGLALRLATLSWRLGQREAALGWAQRAVQLAPESPGAHQILGVAWNVNHDLDAALLEFEKVLALDPRNVEAHGNMSVVLGRQGDRPGALRWLEQALLLDRENVHLRIMLGVILSKKGDAPGARRCFEWALRLDPDSAQAHRRAGSWVEPDLAKARQHLERARALEPRSAITHDSLARLLKREGDLDGAQRSYELAIALDPYRALTHNNLGVLLRDRGDLARARECQQTAIGLDPYLACAHYTLGTVLRMQGDTEDARQCYHETLRLDPDFARALVNLGSILWSEGNAAGAREHWQDAIGANPRLSQAHSNLGMALIQAGNPHRAIGYLETAIELPPPIANAHYNAACCAVLIASDGDEKGEPLPDAERARLRSKALAWLRTAVKLYRDQIERGSNRARASATLAGMPKDDDLRHVRDAEALKELPANEQAAWRKFWAEAEAAQQSDTGRKKGGNR